MTARHQVGPRRRRRRQVIVRGRLLSWDQDTDRAVFVCPSGHLQRQAQLMPPDPRGVMPALSMRRRMAWYWAAAPGPSRAAGVSYPCRACTQEAHDGRKRP